MNYVTVQDQTATIFETKLRECPSVYALALKVAAEFIEDGVLRELTFDASDTVHVASLGGTILGFIIVAEDRLHMEIEFGWVDPCTDDEIIAHALMTQIVTAFWIRSNCSLKAKRQNSPILARVLYSYSFNKGRNGISVYSPFDTIATEV